MDESRALCLQQKNAIATYKSLQRSETGAIQQALKSLERALEVCTMDLFYLTLTSQKPTVSLTHIKKVPGQTSAKKYCTRENEQ